MPAEDERRKPSSSVTLSSAVVRCICISASFVVLACALLGLGVACVAIEKFSKDSGPCPNGVELVVFSTAGGLLLLSLVLFLLVGRKKKKLRARHDEEQLLARASTEPPKPPGESSTLQNQQVNDARKNCAEQDCTENHCEETDFGMTQKSADVSYWIEQQKPMPEECFPLDAPDGATNEDSDTDSSEAEVTAL